MKRALMRAPSSPPGRCGLAALIVAVVLGFLWAFGALSPRPSAAQKKPTKAPQEAATASSKTRSYTFTGLDIDGRLKTPQLLYFLNRMKAEFDTTTPTHRSFLPELKLSTEDM